VGWAFLKEPRFFWTLIQVQEIESDLSSRKQEEAKRCRDVKEISAQVTALQQELDNLDETVDYQVSLLQVQLVSRNNV